MFHKAKLSFSFLNTDNMRQASTANELLVIKTSRLLAY